MSINLENKRILITGSTDGLGKLTALELSKKGAEVILHGRNKKKIQDVINEISAITGKNNVDYVLCDLNKPDQLREKFMRVEKLDILINNAGVWEEGPTLNISESKIMELVNVNLASYLLVSHIVLPQLLKSDFGQILHIISVAGYEVPTQYYHTIYSATKYGLQGFSEALSKEFEGKNLRVMGFYPGGMDTKLFVKAGLDYKEGEDWMFDPMESVEAIIFMLTRNKKVSIKRLDLINHLF